jgi:uncharacterized SAM-binding protein YcdF (DUF218 family)
MMFTFARILQPLLLPPGIFLILMAIGFAVRKDCRVLGKVLVASSFLLLYVSSIGPVTDALIKPLESAYPPLRGAPAKKADVIVVLSGGVRDLSWLGLAPEPSEAAVERVVKGVTLYRRLHIPLMMVGGNGLPAKEDVSEADAMYRVAAGLGVPESELIAVGKVHNTLESAEAVKRRFKGNRIILVTSAFHMRRAAGMFKKKGLEVIPAPCGYRGESNGRSVFSFIPYAANLHYSSSALAEYISLAWYRITGDL